LSPKSKNLKEKMIHPPVVPPDELDKYGDAIDEGRGRVRCIPLEHKSHKLRNQDFALEFFDKHVGPDRWLFGMRRLTDGDDIEQDLRGNRVHLSERMPN
jgi:hypothetical protein